MRNFTPTQFVFSNQKLWRQYLMSVILVAIIFIKSSAQGYVQIVQSAINEESSVGFNYNLSGSAFNQSFILNDSYNAQNLGDLGATTNGGLWATAGGDLADKDVWYRAAGNSTWVNFTTGTAAIPKAGRIDGGYGNSLIAKNASGQLIYWDGTTLSVAASGFATIGDVSISQAATSPRIYFTNGSTGQIFYRDGIGGTDMATGVFAKAIDVAANGDVYFIALSGSADYANGTAYKCNANLDVASKITLGTTANTEMDIAVSGDGNVYMSVEVNQYGAYAYRFNGTAFVREDKSWSVRDNISGGPGSALYGNARVNTTVATTLVPKRIFTKTATGDWIDDNQVRSGVESNTIMYEVPAGNYTLMQTTPTGWWLNSIVVKQTTTGAVITVAAGTANFNIANGEVVTIIYQNGLSVSSSALDDCASAFVENFGSAPSTANYVSTTALSGQTSYHLQPQPYSTMDGYYSITNNSGNIADQVNAPNYYFLDHSNPGTGNFMLVNASNAAEEFFRRRVTGLTVGTTYTFTAWIMSVTAFAIRPNVKFEINNTTTGATIVTTNTGNISATTNGTWRKYSLSFSATTPDVDLVLRNNGFGGSGNDLAIDDVSFSMATDKGDAPASYGTLLADEGPCHSISTNLYMGSIIDAESDGLPTINAMGDNGDGSNDEDGVASFPVIAGYNNSAISNYTVNVAVHNTTGSNAVLTAWIDWNTNGLFDLSEKTSVTVPNNATTAAISWLNKTLTGAPGTAGTYARFRLTTESVVGGPIEAVGSSKIGEVEDYYIPFSVALDIKLISFTAKVSTNNSVVLNWVTSSENNNKGFHLEKRVDGSNWTEFSFVNSLAIGGNSTKDLHYSHIDQNPGTKGVFYRFKQVDFDGSFSYSPVVYVELSASNKIQLQFNQSGNSLNIQNLKGREIVQVFNSAGQVIVSKNSNSNYLTIDLFPQAKGMYIIQVIDKQTGSVENYKIIR